MVLMEGLVMEKKGELKLRDIEVNDKLGAKDCRVKIHSVGICGSDVHFLEHGHIGPYWVEKPMILGHEASGTVVAVGPDVKNLKVGDRVALEPGVPCWDSLQTLNGIYNLDPNVTFFATPPVHGCTSSTVIHPAALCFKLPDNLSFEEGAMVEPMAVGMYAATKASIKPGDVGFVIGSGTIGILTALAALAGGCSEVIVTDVQEERLKVASQFPGLRPVNSKNKAELRKVVDELTGKNGADRVFECSGNGAAYPLIYDYAAPGATCVLVGMPVSPVTVDIVSSQAKEITYQTIFRYRNVYPNAIRVLSSGKINVKPLISAKFSIKDGVKAYERALERNPTDIKIIIQLEATQPSKL